MKFKVYFKDPDAVFTSARDAAWDHIPKSGLSDQQVRDLLDTKVEEFYEAISPWVEFGEYVTIEFDTEAGTATVVKAK